LVNRKSQHRASSRRLWLNEAALRSVQAKAAAAVEVSGVPLVSAQPGYPGENTAWIGPGYLEL
jgi:hypothetical protein